MKFSPSEIEKYYDYKSVSYNSKYQSGYTTHIHTGIFERDVHPFLFDPNFNLVKLGLNRISFFIHRGQDLLINTASQHFRDQKHILDCGSGHGGTSISLAINLEAMITGITLSQTQVDIATEFAEKSSTQKQVNFVKGNIFNYKFDVNFDGIIGIDALCQMGNFNKLFSIFRTLIPQGGKIVIFDNFIRDINVDFKLTFDKYWWSDISTLSQLLGAAARNNFKVINIQDLTKQQIPFWQLSCAHSELLLSQSHSKDEISRLKKSKKFHQDLIVNFSNGNFQYYSIALEKI